MMEQDLPEDDNFKMDRENLSEIFSNMSLKFEHVILKRESEEKFFTVRLSINESEDIISLVEEIEKITDSRFSVKYALSDPICLKFHKIWKCHHAADRKKENSKRNANCSAFIDAKIKNITRGKKYTDPFLNRDVPLPCILKINLDHSHMNNCAASLRMRRLNPEVRKQFENYFANGMKVCEARRLHESKVLAEFNYEKLADASYNPTEDQAYYIWKKWKNANYGPTCDPFEKLVEKIEKYESEGTTVKFDNKKPWTVLIVTPVMKRVQSLISSSEIIFVDSTSGCESSSSHVTIMVTATKAGAVPIAVFIHPNLTAENYENAFSLLKENFPRCFGSKEAPSIFMTDDSDAEKNALRTVWGTAKQLLCHFHVAQAQWRWLKSKNSGIVDENDRKQVLKLFQAVMYADNEKKFHNATAAIFQLKEKFPQFVNRFEKYIRRKEEWCLFYRLNSLTRNNNTNNLCEATFRILKDVILKRTKALNIVALTEFFIGVWDPYLVKKLLEHAYSRVAKHSILYTSLCAKMKNVNVADVLKVDDDTYLVPSNTKENIRYIVQTDVGYCTCIAGKAGGFCKHQCFLLDSFKLELGNAPVLNTDDRLKLAELALGDKCPPRSFFLPFNQESEVAINLPGAEKINKCQVQNPEKSFPLPVELNFKIPKVVNFHVDPHSQCSVEMKDNSNTNISDESEQLVPKILSKPANSGRDLAIGEFNKIFLNYNCNDKKLEKLGKIISKIKNNEDYESAVDIMIKSLSKRTKSGSKIKVQSASVSRRRPGVPRGSGCVPSGRPKKTKS